MIDDRKLIAEIKSHPLLYDPGVPENRDVNAKESTWAFIAKSLGYSVRECKMRWKSLRERFARERKKIVMTTHGDTLGSDEDHDKDAQNKAGTWHLMKEMHFLWNFVFHRNMNRSKSLVYMNAAQDDHPNIQMQASSLSAPLWLLPNINHGSLPPTIQPRAVNQEDSSSEIGEMSTNRVKDPLSDDDDNSLCFDISSSDSDEGSRAHKRQLEDTRPRSRVDTPGLKRMRRNSTHFPTSPGTKNSTLTSNIVTTSQQNEASTSSGILSGSNVIMMNDKEKNPNTPSEGNYSTTAPTDCKDRETQANDEKLNLLSLHSLASNYGCQCRCKGQSEDELFCSSVAASMQRLTAKQRALLKLQIQKVLYEIEYPE